MYVMPNKGDFADEGVSLEGRMKVLSPGGRWNNEVKWKEVCF